MCERSDVKEVVDAAVDAVGPVAEAKGVRIEKVLDPAGRHGDGGPGRLQQIVWNLVANAVKFTPEGGDVRVRMKRTGDRVEVIVSDSGQGIPAHVLPYVFDPISAVGTARARERIAGSGSGSPW
jgi:signal transduction histidine kinase